MWLAYKTVTTLTVATIAITVSIGMDRLRTVIVDAVRVPKVPQCSTFGLSGIPLYSPDLLPPP